MFRKPTIYVSHPIRPNKHSREENLNIAESCAARLRSLFPEVNFYFPSEGEPIFQAVKEAKLLTEEELIDVVDLRILDRCHAHLCLYWASSQGCIKERNCAIRNDIPSLTIPWFINKASYTQVRKTVTPIVETAIRRFRNGN
jgi:hypothetical protein